MRSPDKDEILQAIRFHAAQNGGKPLGSERFEAVTGFRRSAWEGKYWARWSDAIKAAGLVPNNWQGKVLDDDALVRMLAALTIELGRFPAKGDKMLRRRTHPDFPNEKTFASRLGPRIEQVRLVAQFGIDHPKFRDAFDICSPLLDLGTTAPVDLSANVASTGWVYLVKSGDHFKIGRSNHVGRRTYEMALQLPEKLEVVHALETDDPEGIERYWHRRFESTRLNGEWFKLTAQDVAAFKRRGKFM